MECSQFVFRYKNCSNKDLSWSFYRFYIYKPTTGNISLVYEFIRLIRYSKSCILTINETSHFHWVLWIVLLNIFCFFVVLVSFTFHFIFTLTLTIIWLYACFLCSFLYTIFFLFSIVNTPIQTKYDSFIIFNDLLLKLRRMKKKITILTTGRYSRCI